MKSTQILTGDLISPISIPAVSANYLNLVMDTTYENAVLAVRPNQNGSTVNIINGLFYTDSNYTVLAGSSIFLTYQTTLYCKKTADPCYVQIQLNAHGYSISVSQNAWSHAPTYICSANTNTWDSIWGGNLAGDISFIPMNKMNSLYTLTPTLYGTINNNGYPSAANLTAYSIRIFAKYVNGIADYLNSIPTALKAIMYEIGLTSSNEEFTLNSITNNFPNPDDATTATLSTFAFSSCPNLSGNISAFENIKVANTISITDCPKINGNIASLANMNPIAVDLRGTSVVGRKSSLPWINSERLRYAYFPSGVID